MAQNLVSIGMGLQGEDHYGSATPEGLSNRYASNSEAIAEEQGTGNHNGSISIEDNNKPMTPTLAGTKENANTQS